MTETTLFETSIADALKAIEMATDLTASQQTHWPCSLRQISAYANRPTENVPARWSAIKNAVHALHAARVGANPKTLANHKSNARASLLWFGKEKNVAIWGTPLTAPWALLSGLIPDGNRRGFNQRVIQAGDFCDIQRRKYSYPLQLHVEDACSGGEPACFRKI